MRREREMAVSRRMSTRPPGGTAAISARGGSSHRIFLIPIVTLSPYECISILRTASNPACQSSRRTVRSFLNTSLSRAISLNRSV